mgnify:FL=1|tara:strand:+ start:111 stop:1307 length:1197 start_codon:yes stop_codon:yes gene_type:complete
MNKKFKNYLIIYLSFLFFISIFVLYTKHNVGNDSTISEWLINYSGGFTKRGVIGEISIFFARLFDQNLRDIIYIFQLSILGIYYILIYIFFKNLYLERYSLLAIFSPIFLIYPVAEIEVLARKEVFIFVLFLLHALIPPLNNNLIRISKLVILPLSVLIWEPVIFYLPLWIFIDLVKFKIKNYNKNLFNEIIFYFPALLLAIIFIINPLTPEEHFKMEQVLNKEFNEVCYMSCALLKSKSSIYQQFEANFGKYSLEVFVRYFLIILIGFGPLFTLMYYSKFNQGKTIFSKKFNLLSIFLYLLSPVLLLFAMGYDWGRWVSISYIMSLITYFYLYKNRFIILDTKKLNLNKLNLLRPKYFIYIFIIYAFTWNPKTVITGDVASFPLYRIIYKFIKIYLL